MLLFNDSLYHGDFDRAPYALCPYWSSDTKDGGKQCFDVADRHKGTLRRQRRPTLSYEETLSSDVDQSPTPHGRYRDVDKGSRGEGRLYFLTRRPEDVATTMEDTRVDM